MAVVREHPLPDSWDDPEAYLADDRRDALRTGVPIAERVHGAALFADLSGFTPLTEAMHAEYGSSRGAEQLTAALGAIFTAVLDELHRHAGNVVYFSGDAVTCWIDGDDGRLAVACAAAMQRAMGPVQDVALPSGRTFRIGLKVAVAVGAARRFVVGDPDIQLFDVLAGRLIDHLAAAESVAVQGEVVLDESALDALGDAVVIAELRKIADRRCGVLGSVIGVTTLPAVRHGGRRLPDEVVRPWLLPPIWERLHTGGGEFLGELRPAVPIFVRFGGLDFDNDDPARDRLDEFVRSAQRVIDGYGGAALQLTLGDKGAYLYGVFGSPIAHEDDAARACAAAIDLLALANIGSAVTDLQIGIAQGRLRSGSYGHPSRRTFCCLGDAVNLAARLMAVAAPGQIVVADDVQRAAGDRFDWTPLPGFTVKGKRDAVIAHALDGRRARRGDRNHASAMVGREGELGRLAALLHHAASGLGQVVGVCAEAGLGKSRLLDEATEIQGQAGVASFTGEAQPFGTRTSYFAWTQVWEALLDVPDGSTDERLMAVTATVHRLAPDLVPRVPLLGSLVGSEFPDSDLTRSFDAKLRKTSLETLVGEILTAITATRGPLVLVLEDCHWLDPVSADLLNAVARMAAELPLAVVLAYRPLDQADTDAHAWYDAVSSLPYWSEIVLEELSEPATRELIAGEAARLFELDTAPAGALVDAVLARSGGNPFHVQELLTYLWSQKVDPYDEDAVAAVDLPSSLHALVLSRIDMLTERVRRTAKVGSVIGRTFDVRMITQAYPPLGTIQDVRSDTAVLRTQNLVLPEDTDGRRWQFRHAVVRDVAYDSLPFALRATLHDHVARWCERDPELAGAGRRRLDLLAHHYWFTDNTTKKREYLVRAGDAAAADYANAVAEHNYRRAAAFGTDSERSEVLVKLGRVQELTAQWPDAEANYQMALELTRAGHGEPGIALAALADVARKLGRYDEAAQGLQAAQAAFSAAANDDGVGRVLHLAGTLAAQQGRYDEARTSYLASMEIRRRLGDVAAEAALLSNLAVVAEYEGDYAQARMLNEQSLALRRTVGDRWSLGVSHNNLGMVALLQEDLTAARDNFSEALRLNLEVGDSWMVAIARNNLANANVRLGDLSAAKRDFARAYAGYRLLGDRWALAILYEDLAALAVATGRGLDAVRLVGTADALREELGSPRSPAQEAQLTATLAVSAVPLDEAAAARAAAGADPGQVDRLVAEICAGTIDSPQASAGM